MKVVTIGFNVDDTADSLAALLRALSSAGFVTALPTPSIADDVLVDLSSCGFLGPTAIVALGVLRRAALAQGRELSIKPPTLERLYNYCRYSGLLAEFGAGPAPDALHHQNVTRPMLFFGGSTPRDEISETVRLARSQMAVTRAGEGDLKLTLGEVTQNVLDHAGSSVGGCLSARAFSEKREVRFAVADLGVGFRAALHRSGVEVRSAKDALRKVFVDKVSSHSQSHNMGQGLQHLHHIVRLTAGRLVIFSSNGWLDVKNSKNFFRDSDASFPGTLVFVRLPIRPDTTDDEPQATFWDG